METFNEQLILSRVLHTKLKLEYSSRNSSWSKFFAKIKIWFWRHFLLIFRKFGIEQIPNIPKIWTIWKPLFLTPNPLFLPQKQVFFDPITGGFDPNFFAKFLWIQKYWVFLKNFQTSKTQQFRILQKWKIRKIPSFAGA